MPPDTLQATSAVAASLAALAAVLSGVCAFLSYRLARKIHDDLRNDERIVVGTFRHPDLDVPAHRDCVIQCALFNKSRRKAYVNGVAAYDLQDTKIEATWTNKIDDFGNPLDHCQLIGLVDTSPLFIRRNDGRPISYARIEISHSFSHAPMVVIFDLAAWGAE